MKPHSIKAGTIYLLLLLLPQLLNAQSVAKISNITFQVADDIIEIRYDMLDAQPDEEFTIWVKAFKPNGEEVPMKTLIGDIGDGLMGGENKTIFWRVKDDLSSLNSPLYFQVFARSSLNKKSFLPKAVLKSLVLPGWGQSSKGKPYWLIGVGTYGLLGGAVFLNQKSETDYKNYLLSNERKTRDALFQQAENKDKASKMMAYSAGAIWAGNLIWALVSKENKAPKLSFYGTPGSPGLGLVYRF